VRACAGVCGCVRVCGCGRGRGRVSCAPPISLSLSHTSTCTHAHTRARTHTTDGTNEWLFQRTPRPQRSEQEKKIREKKIKKGEIDPKEDCILKSTLSYHFVVNVFVL
jgi:hypothetical protein